MESDAHEALYASARGASKTFGGTLRFLKKALTLEGYEALIFRKRFSEMPTTVFRAMEKAIRLMGCANDVRFAKSKEAPTLYVPATGSSITFSAAEREEHAEKFQGANIHDIGADEAQKFLPAVLEKIPAIARSVEGDHPVSIQYWANPNGPSQSYLKRRFVEPAKSISQRGNIKHNPWTHPITLETFDVDGHWRWIKEVNESGTVIQRRYELWMVRTWMNPALNYHEYLAQLSESLQNNPVLAAQWKDNDWDVLMGEFFPNVQEAAVDHVTVGPYDRILCGIDPGQRKTACVWAAVDDRGRYKVFDARVFHHTPVDSKGPLIRAVRPDTDLYILDPNSGRQTLESDGTRTIRRIYQDNGVDPVVNCKGRDRKEGWEALRTAFSDGTISIDKTRCNNLLESLASLVTKENEEQDCEKDDGTDFIDDGDHLADALRYLFVNGFHTGETVLSKEQKKMQKIIEDDPNVLIALRDSQGGNDGVR